MVGYGHVDTDHVTAGARTRPAPCPQEAWAIWAPTVKEYLNIPDHMTLF